MSYDIVQSVIHNAIFGDASSSGDNAAVAEKITQVAHGFAISEVVSHNGISFIKADVSNEDIVFGIVSNVLNSDVFTISKIGYVQNSSLATLLSTVDSDGILYLGLNGALIPKSDVSIADLNKIPVLKKVGTDKGEMLTSTQYLGFKNDSSVHTMYFGKVGDSDVKEGTWKMVVGDSLLKYYRYEASTWVLKTTLGSGLITDSLVLQDGTGRVSFIEQGGSEEVLMKPSIDGHGAIIGNPNGRVGFVSKGEHTLAYPKTANPVWIVDNAGVGTYTPVGTYYEEIGPIGSDEIMYRIKIYASTGASKFRFAIMNASNNAILLQNTTTSEYNLDINTTPLVAGENIISLKHPMTFTKGLSIKIALWTPTNTSLETGANGTTAHAIYRQYAALSTMNYSKKWREEESYTVGDVAGIEVADIGYDMDAIGRYYCTQTHISGNSFSDDLLAGKWEKISEVGYTDAQIKLKYENNANTNVYSDAEKAKLAGMTGGRYLGIFADLAALQAAYPVGTNGDTAIVTSPNNNMFYWDGTSSAWEDTGISSSGDMLQSVYDPTSKSLDVFDMENMDEGTNSKILTLTERNKLSGIEAGAEVNNISDTYVANLTNAGDSGLHWHSDDRNRANHTGTQTAGTISDFDAEVSNNTDVSGNTAKTSFPEAPIDGVSYVRKDGTWVTGGIQAVYYAESLTESTTNSTWDNKVTLNLPTTFEAGDYFIEIGYGWSSDNKSGIFQSSIELDSIELDTYRHYQEQGVVSDQNVIFKRFKRPMTAGTHVLELNYMDDNNNTASIWDASITITRINILV